MGIYSENGSVVHTNGRIIFEELGVFYLEFGNWEHHGDECIWRELIELILHGGGAFYWDMLWAHLWSCKDFF
jgi:hypothetical protein